MAMTSNKPGPPPEKTITLSSLIAPRLARRGGVDEPFAWESREYLRKLCIGKEVTFRVEYTVSSINRDFGSVFLGDKNVAVLVVSEGWAKVKEQNQKAEASPALAELQRLEEQAKQKGVGRWSQEPGAAEAAIRDLPPSSMGDSSGLDAEALVAANKGKPMEAIVEQVRDGSVVRVHLLPSFQFVQVFVAGVQSPNMGRRPAPEAIVHKETSADDANGVTATETQAATLSQRVAAAGSAAAATEILPEPFGAEAKHFTEIRVLHRDVRIVLEGTDNKNNLVGSLYYPDGETAKDLAFELVENGFAKYVAWSANMMEPEVRNRLKNAELQSKLKRLKIWTNYVPEPSNSKAIHNQNFTGKVVEVVSGDCVVVADDSVAFGSPLAERRVNLSSIRCPRIRGKDGKPEPYASEAKELLRTRLIGQQVSVQMEYSRKVPVADGTAAAPGADARVMDFGSVFLLSPAKGDEPAAPSAAGNQPAGVNIAELLVARGLATVVRHRDFEERSTYYDGLSAADSRAQAGRKGQHSGKQPPVAHINDYTVSNAKKARDILPFLQRKRRMSAVVDYVLSGHRFKLLIPKEGCSIAFSFSGVRCPGRGEPYADEAMAFMRRKIMQRDVEIEVETVDRTGTFLGSLWESKTNMAVTLLEAGLAKFQTAFGTDRIPDAHLLEHAEQAAKRQKLKIWENFVEGEEVSNGSEAAESKQKEVLKVAVTEVLGGGKFYVQTVGDSRVATIQKQLASLTISDAPILGTFNPKKGDLVLAQFSVDNSWNRAMIVNAPREAVSSPKDKFEVFYIDYGNQEEVVFSQLRHIDASVAAAPALAQLCSLAYIKVPALEDEYGTEAAQFFSEQTMGSATEFRAKIEEKDASGGKVKGQGTGTVFIVTLVAVDAEISVNAAMLQEGLARMEKRRKWEPKDRQVALDNLEKFQTEAKKDRRGIWQYGDVESDDEDLPPLAAKKAGGRR